MVDSQARETRGWYYYVQEINHIVIDPEWDGIDRSIMSDWIYFQSIRDSVVAHCKCCASLLLLLLLSILWNIYEKQLALVKGLKH